VVIRFSITGTERRTFADAIGEILGQDVIYNRTPTFAYTIGDYVVDREGALTFPADIFDRESIDLIMALRERGYEVETDGAPEITAALTPQGGDDSNRLVVDMPLEGFTENALENLKKIVASKNRLMQKALGTDGLKIDVSDEKLSFPWFILTGTDGETDAYLRLITALCVMPKKQKRVIAQERPLENEKFIMRVFLIRLGFIGPEFKTARKILLKNLSGNSAWKNGKPPERTTVAENTVYAKPAVELAHTEDEMRKL